MLQTRKFTNPPKGKKPATNCRLVVSVQTGSLTFRTQNGLQPYKSLDYVNPDNEVNYDFNHHFLSYKYDGLLLCHDLDPRILRAKEMLRQSMAAGRFKNNYGSKSTQIEDSNDLQRRELKTKLLFVFDTFERVETSRRTEACRLLEEKHRFKIVKARFLQMRTDLLNGVTDKMHKSTSGYAKDFDDLEKHRHFLEKENSNIRLKIEKAERINKGLMSQISYVQNYGPLIAEKLQTEEVQLQLMKQQKIVLEAKLKDLETDFESTLANQDLVRNDFQRKKTVLYEQLEKSTKQLHTHREKRLERRKHVLPHHTNCEYLRNKILKLQKKETELRNLLSELKGIVEDNKVETEAILTKVKTEHARHEAKKQAEAAKAAAEGRPVLTKEERKEKLKILKARQEKKAKQQRKKALQKQQVLERNIAKLRTQMKEATDHISSLQADRVSLGPQLERLDFLEETFQAEYDEKSDLKMDLTLELEKRTEKLEEAQQKLEEFQVEYKIKIAAQRLERDSARKARRAQEKLVNDMKKKDQFARYQLNADLHEIQTILTTAVASRNSQHEIHEKILRKNRETLDELNEIQLATKITYELLPGDEEKRRSKEVQLEIETQNSLVTLQNQYTRIGDKIAVCVQLALDKDVLRNHFVPDLAEYRQLTLVAIPEQKMQFDVAFSAYRMLMWHYRRLMTLTGEVKRYGNNEREYEKQRVLEMWKYTRQQRQSLQEALQINFRAVRRCYHLNVIYHILHIENVREYFRNRAADDSYHSAKEVLAAEKVFKVNIEKELTKRQLYWNWTVCDYRQKLSSQARSIMDIHEYALLSADQIWKDLKDKVIDRQRITLSEELKPTFEGNFRKT